MTTDRAPTALETPLKAISEIEILASGLDHPEGVAAGADGTVIAGGEAGQVYSVAPDGSWEEIASTGGFVLGVTRDGDSNIYACDLKLAAVMKIAASGGVDVYARGVEDRAMAQPNSSVFDDEGYLYVSDSGGFGTNDGCLWVVDPAGTTRLLSDDVRAFPNGLALSADRRFLYVALSTLPGVVRLEVAEGRALGEVEFIASLPDTVPDGLAFDESGNLFVSCYAPDVIFRIRIDGTVETFAYDPLRGVLASPTNLAFCHADRRLLVIANLAGWHLARTEMEIAGAPLAYPHNVGPT